MPEVFLTDVYSKDDWSRLMSDGFAPFTEGELQDGAIVGDDLHTCIANANDALFKVEKNLRADVYKTTVDDSKYIRKARSFMSILLNLQHVLCR